MSIFSVNKAAKSRAQTFEAQAAQEQESIQRMEFASDLLQNIRQERIARSQLEFANYIEGVNTSSAAGAIANIDSALAGEVGYAYRYSKRLEDMQYYQRQATEQWEKYAKSVKRAKTNAQIAVSTAGLLAGGVAGLAGATALGVATATTIGSMGAAGGVSLIGDNSIAGNAAWSTAIKQSAQSFASAGFQQAASKFMQPKVIYDVTGTARTGSNVSFTNASYTGQGLTWNS